MSLIKYQPYTDLDIMDRGLSRFFDSLFDVRKERDLERILTPKADVLEDKDKYLISIEAPGLKKEDAKLTVNNNILTISGEKKDEKKVEKKNYLFQELSYGKFERSFTLPDGVEADKIDAEIKNGLLEITIPKSEKQKPKEIEVKVK